MNVPTPYGTIPDPIPAQTVYRPRYPLSDMTAAGRDDHLPKIKYDCDLYQSNIPTLEPPTDPKRVPKLKAVNVDHVSETEGRSFYKRESWSRDMFGTAVSNIPVQGSLFATHIQNHSDADICIILPSNERYVIPSERLKEEHRYNNWVSHTDVVIETIRRTKDAYEGDPTNPVGNTSVVPYVITNEQMHAHRVHYIPNLNVCIVPVDNNTRDYMTIRHPFHAQLQGQYIATGSPQASTHQHDASEVYTPFQIEANDPTGRIKTLHVEFSGMILSCPVGCDPAAGPYLQVNVATQTQTVTGESVSSKNIVDIPNYHTDPYIRPTGGDLTKIFIPVTNREGDLICRISTDPTYLWDLYQKEQAQIRNYRTAIQEKDALIQDLRQEMTDRITGYENEIKSMKRYIGRLTDTETRDTRMSLEHKELQTKYEEIQMKRQQLEYQRIDQDVPITILGIINSAIPFLKEIIRTIMSFSSTKKAFVK